MALAQINVLGTIAIVVQCCIWLRLSRALADASDRDSALDTEMVPTGGSEPKQRPAASSRPGSRLTPAAARDQSARSNIPGGHRKAWSDSALDRVLRVLPDLAPGCVLDVAREISYYDSRTRTIGLASAIVREPSLAGLAVGIHELGHAIQQREAAWLIELHPAMRGLALVGMAAGAIAVACGSVLAPVIASAGLLGCELSLLAGLSLVLLERDASRRGLRRVIEIPANRDDPPNADLARLRGILDEAALTYLTAPLDGLALVVGIFSSG